MGGIFVRREELQLTNTTQNIALNSHTQGFQVGSFCGNITKVLAKEAVCLVDSGVMGKNARIRYLPEVGVRKGAACAVSLVQGIPTITAIMNLGNDEMLVCDPLGGEDGDEYFILGTPSGGGSDEENATGDSTGIMHADGEKVLACDFSGVRAGLDHSVLFYEANSKIFCSHKLAAMVANTAYIYAEGGEFRLDEPEDGNSVATRTPLGKVSLCAFEYGGPQKAFEVVREYMGDVNNIMKDDEFKIFSLPGTKEIKIEEAVYLFAVIDRNADKYTMDRDIVSHTYINRKLEVNGGGTGSGAMHTEFMTAAKLDPTVLKSSAILGTVGGAKVAITYLKIITLGGDVYEHSAGKSVTVEHDSKYIAKGRCETYKAGLTTNYFQDTMRNVQYPISEDTIVYNETFGTVIDEKKGLKVEQCYRENIGNYINSQVKYEVDKSSDIETIDYTDSPVIVRKRLTNVTMYEEHDEIDNDAFKLDIVSTDKKNIISGLFSGSGFEFTNYVSGGKKDARFMHGTYGLDYMSKDGYTSMESRIFRKKADYNLYDGVTVFKDLFIDGRLNVVGSDIVFNAEEYLVLTAKNLYTIVDGACYTEYKDYFYVTSNADGVNDDGVSKQNSVLYLSDFTSYLAGDFSIIYGSDTIYAFAKENGAFGAKTATFYGSNR
jgi:hypothetical protein